MRGRTWDYHHLGAPQPTPMILNPNVHFTRVSDLVGRDDLDDRPASANRRLS